MRFHNEDGFAASTIICNTTYADTIAEDFSSGEPKLAALVAEPARRDTAAAAALAAFYVKDQNPDDYVLLLPSDHHIRRPGDFAAAIRQAAATAQAAINTFGIIPARPDTGFGYIQRDTEQTSLGALYQVSAFVEKPDAVTAQTYLDAGTYYWNAGIFLYRPDTFLNELKRLQPGIYEAVSRSWAERDVSESFGTPISTPSNAFLDSDGISLDYAVMEKTIAATVMPIDVGWDDLGSWSAMHDLQMSDETGSAHRGDAHLFGCENVYVDAGSRLVVASDVSNLIVVETADSVLVCHRDSAQGVKAIHSQLVANGRSEAEYHPDRTSRRLGLRKFYRDWLVKHVLPLWSVDGIDIKTGLPFEALSYDGIPVEDTLRTRVISRQIFTYAFAADQFDWNRDRALSMISQLASSYDQYVRSETGSVARIDRSGQIVDPRWDTYDQAFHLLAMAWAYRISGDTRYVNSGKIALTELLTNLKHNQSGYKEDATGSCPRRANPHMHLLEAALAWLPTDEASSFRPLAEECVSLFHDHFCQNGLLFERFNEALSAIDNSCADDAIEPGHLYEWATLVKLAAAEGIMPDRAGMTATLIGFADVYGQNTVTNLVYDTGSADGQTMSHTHRLWPQTEKVRHHLLYGTPIQQDDALRTLESIRRLYLDPSSKQGLWRDKLAEDLVDLGDRSPASTLYHLINMIAVI